MSAELMSTSGFIGEDELTELVDGTESGGFPWLTVVSASIALSAALPDFCPTGACTKSCR
ncbi:class II lanthipeptide, LchA2/BrtA2 family [uncultured Cellulomonas sp.]|uniref:class II lanthipeptide, LchA2/BrtA2 family n=1 Tax=uncultured Cellulomonas sp. TaxID=189682 RepID=UPI0028F14A1C|nr:class II lanthipeptide, LchA2/BrtA2 family [uncultured Cellulomonas sp.]